MNDIKVIDNFLENNDSHNIFKKITDSYFKWYLSSEEYTVNKDIINEMKTRFKNLKEHIQFVHSFFEYNDKEDISNDFKHIKPVFDKLIDYTNGENIDLLRAKVNLQPQCKDFLKDNHNCPHIDNTKIKHKTLLYYVNDSDGDTFFFNDKDELIKRVTPKKNRAVLFDGDILHCGSHPVESLYRIVLNINYNQI